MIVAAVLTAARAEGAMLATVAGGGSNAPADGATATSVNLGGVNAVSPTSDGGFLVSGGSFFGVVSKVSPAGTITRVAGTDVQYSFAGDGGPALDGVSCEIAGLLADPAGGFLIADRANHRIRRVSGAGTLSTFSGDGAPEEGRNGCTRTSYLNYPGDIERHPAGGWVIADEGSSSIDYVPSAGGAPTVSAAPFNNPVDVSVTAGGDVLVAAYIASRIYRVSGFGPATGSGSSTVAAGDGTHNAFAGDGGAAVSAKLRFPRGVAATPDGGFVIADTDNHRIRYVDPGGTISTIAGGGAGGDGPALEANLADPRKVVPSPEGLLIVEFNNRVQRIDKTTITSGPGAFTDQPSATISFDSYYPGASFQCRADGGDWSTCTSPKTFPGLADGPHTVDVRGVDGDGADPTPASRSFTVDTTGPNTYIVSKPGNPSPTATAQFSFSSPSTGATFKCRLDGGAWASCTSPKNYPTLADESHTFEVEATDATAHPDPTPATYTWVVDTTAPQTSVTDGPPPATQTRPATLTFSSNESGSEFSCRLDAGAWEPCTSPKDYSVLGVGSHAFEVRATDVAGNTDATPATRNWTIDESPPQTTIPTGPPPATQATTADFTFASDEPDPTYSCRLDHGAWQACLNPKTYVSLAEGDHVLEVRASDPANNVDPSPAVHAWKVDHTAPVAFALLSPGNGAGGQVVAPTFSWAPATDAVAGVDHYEVVVDGTKRTDVLPAGCGPSSCTYALSTALGGGAHDWLVRAVDAAGNQRVSSTRTFVVDADTPQPFDLGDPGDGARLGESRPTLTWGGSGDAGSGIDHYELSIDGAVVAGALPAAARSFTVPSPLADGAHTWFVTATDGAHNARTSLTRSFIVDTTAPVASVVAAPNPALAGRAVTFEAGASTDQNGAIASYEWDLDGDGTFEIDTHTATTASRTYSDPGIYAVQVRVTDQTGLRATASVSLRVLQQSGPHAQLGVTINNGALFTKDRNVTISSVWPGFASQMLVSNDGGFLAGTSLPLTTKTSWTLDTTGPERLPKTVYVRFVRGFTVSETYQDDIVLDEAPPVVAAANIAPHKGLSSAILHIRARDRGPAGVGGMQVTNTRGRAGTKFRAYRATLLIKRRKHGVSASRPLFIRVRDRAGNTSKWRRATAPRSHGH